MNHTTNKPGRKPNKLWESLTEETPIGNRFLAAELAEKLRIKRTSANNYFKTTPLPSGWRVVKIGGTCLIERIPTQ